MRIFFWVGVLGIDQVHRHKNINHVIKIERKMWNAGLPVANNYIDKSKNFAPKPHPQKHNA